MELADAAANIGEQSEPGEAGDSPEFFDAPDGSSLRMQSPVDPETYTPSTLRSYLKQRGRLPVEECIRLMLALTAALSHLHRHKLVHRDVKPSNVIFVYGIPKLADVGLVARSDEARSLVGTDGYIPPEGPGMVQADIYSLGKVLYEAAIGKDRLRFPEPLSNVEANVELAELNQVILKACDSDPKRRYASADEMREDLLVLQSGKSVRRLRHLERRVSQLTKLATVAGVLILLATAGGLLQRRQARELARVADESRRNLMRVHINQGLRALEEGEYLSALPWFVEALKATRTPEEAWPHQRRIEAVLRQSPGIVALGLHGASVNSAEFSPDGRLIATTSDDGTARIWDAATAEPVTPPLAHDKPVNEARFSADGRRIVTAGSDGTARVWEIVTGKLLVHLRAHSKELWQASFSPDGRLILTASEDGSARVWDAQTGAGLGSMIHEKAVNHAAFSPDGQWVVTASDDGTARLWRTDGTAAGFVLRHANQVRWAAFSPDGRKVVSAGDDGTVHLWHTATGLPLLEPIAAAPQVYYAVFSPDGNRLLACGGHIYNYWGEARIWDVATGRPLSAPMRHSARIKHASFSPDGRRLATASHDGTVRLWSADSGTPIGPPIRHHQAVWSAVFSAGGNHLLTAGRSPAWRLWNVRIDEWNKPEAFAHTAIPDWDRRYFSFDGSQVLIRPRTNSVQVWTVSPPAPGGPLLAHPQSVLTAQVSPDGRRVVTACSDGKVRLWDAATGELTAPPIPHADEVRSVAFSPDGSWIASAGFDRTVRLWNAATGAERIPPLRHKYPVWFVEFCSGNELLVTCSTPFIQNYLVAGASYLHVWNLRSGRPVTPALGHGWRLTQPAISPDGHRVIVGCVNALNASGDAHVWDTRTGREICPPLKHSAGVTWVAISPNGRHVATASEKAARIWDANSGEPVGAPMMHQHHVYSACFSPDGDRLLTTSQDHTARLWDVTTGDPLGPALRHPEPVTWACFSPDGQTLLTSAGHNRVARLWRCPTNGPAIDRLELISRVLSGTTIDAASGPITLTPQQLQQAFRQSRASSLSGR
jgi:WD40 repeat protein